MFVDKKMAGGAVLRGSRVTDPSLLPKQFLVCEVTRERQPLAPTARRAGWISCNILLGDIPASALEDRLKAIYPGNNNVRAKIRQQLQVLRDQGYLSFVGRGRYRVRAA